VAIAYGSAGAGAGTETDSAALNVVCPATVNAGDILIAHVIHTGTSTAPSTPQDWSPLFGPSNVGTTPTARHWCFGKLAVGDEDGDTISFGTAGGTNGRAGRIYRFTGRTSGTLADCVPSASFTGTPHANDPQGPSVTTTHSGSLAIALYCQDDNTTHAAAIAGSTGGTWSVPVAEYVSSSLGPQGLMLGLNVCTPTSNPGTVSGGEAAGNNDEANTIGFEIRPSSPPHALTATGIATGAPSVGSPTIGQVHILTATGVANAAPSVGTPTVGQEHDLTASAVSAGTPTVGSPTAAEIVIDELEAAGIATAAPSIGAPTIAQEQVLSATGIASGAVVVGSPALGQVHVLSGQGITTSAPSVGTPTAGQAHALTAGALATAAPSVGGPGLGQEHVLTAAAVSAGAPAVGAPTVDAEGEDALSAAGIATGAVALGSPVIAQIHALEAVGITAGFELGTPGSIPVQVRHGRAITERGVVVQAFGRPAQIEQRGRLRQASDQARPREQGSRR
jgi:hypothetical protein